MLTSFFSNSKGLAHWPLALHKGKIERAQTTWQKEMRIEASLPAWIHLSRQLTVAKFFLHIEPHYLTLTPFFT